LQKCFIFPLALVFHIAHTHFPLHTFVFVCVCVCLYGFAVHLVAILFFVPSPASANTRIQAYARRQRAFYTLTQTHTRIYVCVCVTHLPTHPWASPSICNVFVARPSFGRAASFATHFIVAISFLHPLFGV